MSRAATELPRNVKALSAVSLLTDVSSEMIYPLLPVFITTVLGASVATVGAIEGAAESTASILKLASGWWSDRVRRKPLVLFGYGLAAVARPLMGIAASVSQVLAIRLLDRVGKGVRSSPRDALLADSVAPGQRGRAFGFHRAADNMGAVIGPLIAWALLQSESVPLRSVFLWAAVPGLLSIVILVLFVREGPRASVAAASANASALAGTPSNASFNAEPSAAPHAALLSAPLGKPFRSYLLVLLLFTLGNSSDAFLLLRATELGVPVALVPVLWAMLSLVKSLSSTPGGALSDRLGRKPLIVGGWLIFAVVYLLLGQATAAWHVWALFVVYGLHFGMTEGVEKALVADLVPAARRGAAYGWYNLTIGLGALPASLLFGLIWSRYGAASAFALGATLALTASVGLLMLVPRTRTE